VDLRNSGGFLTAPVELFDKTQPFSPTRAIKENSIIMKILISIDVQKNI
jgi:hypothetical protein